MNTSQFWTAQQELCKNEKNQVDATAKIINMYFKLKNMSASVILGVNPKSKQPALKLYSGMDADFDFEGYVDCDDTGHEQLDKVLTKLNVG